MASGAERQIKIMLFYDSVWFSYGFIFVFSNISYLVELCEPGQVFIGDGCVKYIDSHVGHLMEKMGRLREEAGELKAEMGHFD